MNIDISASMMPLLESSTLEEDPPTSPFPAICSTYVHIYAYAQSSCATFFFHDSVWRSSFFPALGNNFQPFFFIAFVFPEKNRFPRYGIPKPKCSQYSSK